MTFNKDNDIGQITNNAKDPTSGSFDEIFNAFFADC